MQDGFLGAGNGYLASIGEPEGMVQVADGTVDAAPVSLAVPDSSSSGRRVAFVEIRLESAPPVDGSRDLTSASTLTAAMAGPWRLDPHQNP